MLMFEQSGIETAPELPCRHLMDYCYSNMFENAKNLRIPPDIIFEDTKIYALQNMFTGCESLERMAKISMEPCIDFTKELIKHFCGDKDIDKTCLEPNVIKDALSLTASHMYKNTKFERQIDNI